MSWRGAAHSLESWNQPSGGTGWPSASWIRRSRRVRSRPRPALTADRRERPHLGLARAGPRSRVRLLRAARTDMGEREDQAAGSPRAWRHLGGGHRGHDDHRRLLGTMPLRLVAAGNGDRHSARLQRLSTGSTFELRAIPRDGGGSAVEMVITRNFRNGPKGTIARSINHLAGRRLFGWYLRTTLAAIEQTSADNSTTKPTEPRP